MFRHQFPCFHRVAFVLVLVLSLLGTSAAQSIPAGTSIEVRMTENLSSGTAKAGDVFHGSLMRAITVGGRTIPKGAQVTGRVVAVEASGRLSNPGELHLSLDRITHNGRTYQVQALLALEGESHAKSNVGKIGGGAAAGAIVGAIAGGGKGAAIGAGVGAAAGTGVAAATGKREIVVESESVLTWVVDKPSQGEVVKPAAMHESTERRSDRHRDDQDGNSQGDRSRRGDIDGSGVFSARDREIISGCFSGSSSKKGLPPGLAKKEKLPPGLDRQLKKNGTLPPGLEKKVQHLPQSCATRLPRLPDAWVRVVVEGQVLLLDRNRRILDLFVLASVH